MKCEICKVISGRMDDRTLRIESVQEAYDAYHARANRLRGYAKTDYCDDPQHMEHCGFVEGFRREAAVLEAFLREGEPA